MWMIIKDATGASLDGCVAIGWSAAFQCRSVEWCLVQGVVWTQKDRPLAWNRDAYNGCAINGTVLGSTISGSRAPQACLLQQSSPDTQCTVCFLQLCRGLDAHDWRGRTQADLCWSVVGQAAQITAPATPMQMGTKSPDQFWSIRNTFAYIAYVPLHTLPVQ